MWRNRSTCTYSGTQFKNCNGEVFFITRLSLVWIWSENLPKYGSTIIKSCLGTVLTTTCCVNTLSKTFLYICQRSYLGNYFYTRYLSIYLFQDGISQNLNTHWSIGTTVIQLNRFCRFQVWAVEISINTTEGYFLINISDKFSFVTKNADV